MLDGTCYLLIQTPSMLDLLLVLVGQRRVLAIPRKLKNGFALEQIMGLQSTLENQEQSRLT